MPRKCDWTEEQIEILKQEYAKNTPPAQIAEIVGKSINGVKMKASRLRIAKPSTVKRESKPHKDLTGMKFGRLTAIRPLGKNEYSHMIWECECSCDEHNIVTRSEYDLMSGRNCSCGCYKKDFCKDNFSKKNTYDLSGEYGVGWTEEGEKFLFDIEDYDVIKGYYWRVGSYGYMQTLDKEQKVVMMHRLVMGVSRNDDYKGIDVDHIHGDDVRDNRKCNLRLATRTENNMNRRLQSNNTSGVTGVTLNKQSGNWIAQMELNGDYIYLGTFDNFDDAVAARKAGEEKYFGERSYDNSRNAVID